MLKWQKLRTFGDKKFSFLISLLASGKIRVCLKLEAGAVSLCRTFYGSVIFISSSAILPIYNTNEKKIDSWFARTLLSFTTKTAFCFIYGTNNLTARKEKLFNEWSEFLKCNELGFYLSDVIASPFPTFTLLTDEVAVVITF